MLFFYNLHAFQQIQRHAGRVRQSFNDSFVKCPNICDKRHTTVNVFFCLNFRIFYQTLNYAFRPAGRANNFSLRSLRYNKWRSAVIAVKTFYRRF